MKKLKQKLKDQGYEEEYHEQMGYAYRKMRFRKSAVRNSNKIETNIFKKKHAVGENGTTTGNTMLIRRIKKIDEEDIEIQ